MTDLKKIRLMISVCLCVLLISCNNTRNYDKTSRATGVDITGRKGGPKFIKDFVDDTPGPGLVPIKGGTFTMGQVRDDVMHEWNNIPTQQHVQSFYMDETEVTNNMYLQYLYWLKSKFPPTNQNYKNIYSGALPDTLVWRNPLGFNESMVKNYLRHPSYAKYPVVGVNWIQATEFSEWRTNRVNERRLDEEGYTKKDITYSISDTVPAFSTETYLAAPTKAYGGNEEILTGGKVSQNKLKRDSTSGKFVNKKDGVLLPAEYRLPTEAEWEFAALGLSSVREYNSYRGKKKYPWDGKYTRSGNKRTIGDQKANFKQGAGDYGGIAGWSDDNASYTAPIKSYEPNDFGLYDMAGNVAEWVADVYRPKIDNEFNDFNYFRGNVYTKYVINEDGTVEILNPNEVQYDTLSDGKIVYRSLPGEIKKEPIDDKETYLRTQFNRADNIDFRDGDKQSSRYFGLANELTDDQRMYNSPKHKIEADSTKLIREYDKSNNRTTLINNKIRVIKGGSWRDRAYWLDPAQRRFYPQDMSTDYIGFRNAMSMSGSTPLLNQKTRN
ncbi:gliding motility lipoprotein GldJ [Psychroflexus sp. MBR-150]|jgi:gliding motility-associated lipoprotein GldJ